MPQNEICVVNARVITMDERHSVAEAFRVRDGIIVAIGKRDDVLQAADVEVVDLGGATVLPGLIDAHSHLDLLAFSWEIAVDCRSTRVASVEQIVDVLREKAEATESNQWVLGQGEHYQDVKLAERRYPDRHDLDRVSTRHPVMYRASYHINVFNSLALDVLGVDNNTPNAPAGRIERDNDGVATGRTFDMFSALNGPQPSVEVLSEGIKRVQQRYLSVGVTTLGEIPLHAEAFEALRRLAERDPLVLRMSAYPKFPTVVSMEDITSSEFGSRFSFGDRAHFKLSGVKIFLDGGLTAGAAALYEDYPGKPGFRGELAFSDDFVREIVRVVDEAGLQIAMHAIGDRALDQAIVAVEALPPARRGIIRHRIEHAGNVFMTVERMKRLAQSHIVPVPQPSFLLTTAAGYIAHLGRERIGTVMPFRTMIDNGLPIPGNSDAIGITADQHNPFIAMQAAITRRTKDGAVLEPDEAVSVDEALTMYTRWAAYSIGREAEIGSLEVGKHADFVVTNVDPTQSADLGKVIVESTWIDGQQYYSRTGETPTGKRPKPVVGSARST